MKCFRSRLTRDDQTGSRYLIVSEIDHMIRLVIFKQQTKFQSIPITGSRSRDICDEKYITFFIRKLK